MRLGTCIALELAVATGAVFGVWFGVGKIASETREYLAGREAVAATMPAREVPELPRSQLAIELPIVVDNVFGAPDAELLGPLGRGKVTRATLDPSHEQPPEREMRRAGY